MSALQALLARGDELLLAQERARIEEAAQKQAEEEKRQAAQIEDAKRLAREYLGPVFDEMAGEAHNDGYGRVQIRLKWGPGACCTQLTYSTRDQSVSLGHQFGRHDYRSLPLPAEPDALALFLAQCKANYDERRADDLDRALIDLRSLDPDFDQESTIEYYMLLWPDLADELQVEAAKLKAEAEAAKAKLAARKAHEVEVQSQAWFWFIVWRLTYAARVVDDAGETHVLVRTAYSLEGEPNGDGYWPVVSRGGTQTATKFPALLKVEQVVVDSWESDVARAVCRRTEVDGVKVLVPPHGAVAYE